MNVSTLISENGWAEAKSVLTKLFIKTKEYASSSAKKLSRPMAVLNYSGGSPKDNVLCNECRALIVYTDNGEVASCAFNRFFNEGENDDDNVMPENLDISDYHVYRKEDGSIISIYWCESTDRWEIATRGMAFAEGEHPHFASFRDAVLDDALHVTEEMFQVWCNTQLSKFMTYIFEYVSPKNRIVMAYDESYLVLLGVRNKYGGYRERSWKRVEYIFCTLRNEQIRLATVLPFDKNSSLHSYVGDLASNNILEEGVVIRHKKNGMRLKIKNKYYVQMHHNIGRFTDENRARIIFSGEEFEYLKAFPDEEKNLEVVKNTIARMVSDMEDCLRTYDGKEMRYVAKEISKFPFASVMFTCLKKRMSVSDVWNSLSVNDRVGVIFVRYATNSSN